jgi:poly(3-hydroxybutyrate) depolymerase
MVTFTAGGVQRRAQVWIDPNAARNLDGPLVFYFYGTSGSPSQAVQALGTTQINRIKAAGGLVVAPVHVPRGTFPWIAPAEPSDLPLVDQIVACAKQTVGIDSRRIHASGFSAGGIFTGGLSLQRSSYMASVATYSGGSAGPSQDPNNKFAAMIVYGGANDRFIVDFAAQAQGYYNQLTNDGHFAILCNHGRGHTIPGDAGPSITQFFFDHPFGTKPSPYAQSFPGGFVSYCRR